MKLRGIHPNDTAEVKRIHLLAFEGVGETANTVSAILRDKKFGNIVAEADRRVVGYSFFHQQGKSLYLNWIAVLPEAEGTGAAQIMLQEVEKWANRESRCGKVRASDSPFDNQAASVSPKFRVVPGSP